MHADEGYLRELLQLKAAGYVLKQSAGAKLLQAIRQVAGGEVYFDHALATSAFRDVAEARTGGGKIRLDESGRVELVPGIEPEGVQLFLHQLGGARLFPRGLHGRDHPVQAAEHADQDNPEEGHGKTDFHHGEGALRAKSLTGQQFRRIKTRSCGPDPFPDRI